MSAAVQPPLAAADVYKTYTKLIIKYRNLLNEYSTNYNPLNLSQIITCRVLLSKFTTPDNFVYVPLWGVGFKIFDNVENEAFDNMTLESVITLYEDTFAAIVNHVQTYIINASGAVLVANFVDLDSNGTNRMTNRLNNYQIDSVQMAMCYPIYRNKQDLVRLDNTFDEIYVGPGAGWKTAVTSGTLERLADQILGKSSKFYTSTGPGYGEIPKKTTLMDIVTRRIELLRSNSEEEEFYDAEIPYAEYRKEVESDNHQFYIYCSMSSSRILVTKDKLSEVDATDSQHIRTREMIGKLNTLFGNNSNVINSVEHLLCNDKSILGATEAEYIDHLAALAYMKTAIMSGSNPDRELYASSTDSIRIAYEYLTVIVPAWREFNSGYDTKFWNNARAQVVNVARFFNHDANQTNTPTHEIDATFGYAFVVSVLYHIHLTSRLVQEPKSDDHRATLIRIVARLPMPDGFDNPNANSIGEFVSFSDYWTHANIIRSTGASGSSRIPIMNPFTTDEAKTTIKAMITNTVKAPTSINRDNLPKRLFPDPNSAATIDIIVYYICSYLDTIFRSQQ